MLFLARYRYRYREYILYPTIRRRDLSTQTSRRSSLTIVSRWIRNGEKRGSLADVELDEDSPVEISRQRANGFSYFFFFFFFTRGNRIEKKFSTSFGSKWHTGGGAVNSFEIMESQTNSLEFNDRDVHFRGIIHFSLSFFLFGTV